MSNKEEVQKMRKNNMRIFPAYKGLAWDYLFFYTIDFLFLTQVKGISASDVMLKSTFYAFFGAILQIPGNMIVEFLGKKNSIILGNILNCLYMLIIMMSQNLVDLIVAEFFGAMATSIKNVAEPSLLNESIPPSKYKSQIYARINGRGAYGFYILNAISKIVAGLLFAVNGYLPIMCSLFILILATILSFGFIEPIQKNKTQRTTSMYVKQMKEIKEGFAFVFKSERLKALILCAALIYALLSILSTYHVSLQEDIGLTSTTIGLIAAIGGLLSAFASKNQKTFHEYFRNQTLFVISMGLSVSTIIAGIFGIYANEFLSLLLLVIISYLTYNYCMGMFYTIIDKYLRNFSNEKIDTKIFAAYNLFRSIFRMIGGILAAFLLGKMETAYCMIIIGIVFTIIYLALEKYMRTRLGLKPEQYSKEERKYDELLVKKDKNTIKES